MFPPQPTQNCKPGSPGLVHPCPAGTSLMGGHQDSPAWLSSTRAVLSPSSWPEGLHGGCSFSRPPSTRGRRGKSPPQCAERIEKVLFHILPSEGSKQKAAVRSHQQSLPSSQRLCCKRKHLFSPRSREPGQKGKFPAACLERPAELLGEGGGGCGRDRGWPVIWV